MQLLSCILFLQGLEIEQLGITGSITRDPQGH